MQIKPHISLNKLGEYMTATASRRKRIILDQKDPKKFIVTRYSRAQEAICSYLQSDSKDESILFEAIDRLYNAATESKWQKETNHLCIDAIKHFLELKDKLNVADYTCENMNFNESPKLNIGGVEISIRPELVVSAKEKNKQYNGFMKLAFSKNYKLCEKAGEYVATVLHEYASQSNALKKTQNTKCLVVDVFDKRIVSSPTARKKRMQDVVAACEEIRKVW